MKYRDLSDQDLKAKLDELKKVLRSPDIRPVMRTWYEVEVRRVAREIVRRQM